MKMWKAKSPILMIQKILSMTFQKKVGIEWNSEIVIEMWENCGSNSVKSEWKKWAKKKRFIDSVA